MVGRRRPAIGRHRIPAQRRDPRRHEREPPVAGDHVLPEQVEPTTEGGAPPVPVVRETHALEQLGSPLRVAARVRVHEGVLEHPGFLETVRRPPMQLRDRVGFAPCELRPKHVAEQMVVPVPLALTIERDQEEVLALDRLEGASGAGPLHDRVAHRPVEAIEDRGPDEEALPVPGEGPEDFGADVVDDEAIVAGEPDRWQGGPPLLLQGQRGEVQADRPSLGRVGELGRLGLGGLDPGTPKEPVRLRRPQGEVVDADLDQPTVGAEPSESVVRDGAAGQGEQRTRRDVAGERHDRIRHHRLREAVDVVQDQDERPRSRGERRAETREHPPRADAGRRRDGLEHAWIDALDPIERDRDVSQEDNGVTVGLVDRDPRERAPVAFGPLGEQGGLAVAGGGGDGRPPRRSMRGGDRRARCAARSRGGSGVGRAWPPSPRIPVWTRLDPARPSAWPVGSSPPP